MSYFHKTLRDFMRFLHEREVQPAEEEITHNWEETVGRMARRASRRRARRLWYGAGATAAAAVAALLWLALPGGEGLMSRRTAIEVYALKTPPSYSARSDSPIKLLMAGGNEMEIASAEALVDHDADGSLTVNHDPVAVPVAVSEDYNQLIVPYGRRSRLTLADGSRMWVNSGSRVIYPSEFDGRTREVFLEGEAYLEVSADKSRPFIVKTASLNVTVTGTRFNVFAYPGEEKSEVALAQGRVTVSNDASRRVLDPGHVVSGNPDGTLSAPRRADIASRISWVSSTLVYDNEPIEAVFDRLRLYYGKRFEPDTDLGHIHISGKLAMPGSLDEVLESISFSVPLTFEHTDSGTIAVHSLK